MADSYHLYHVCVSRSREVTVLKQAPESRESEKLLGRLRYAKNTRSKTRIQALVERVSSGECNLDELGELGELLFQVLFEPVLGADLLRLYEEVRRKDGGVRLVLEIDEDGLPDVAALPWEFLRAPRAGHGTVWLATAPSLVFSRRKWRYGAPPVIDLQPGERLRVGLAVAQPHSFEGGEEFGPIKYEQVLKALQDLAQTEPDRFELLAPVISATRAALDDLLDKRPHVFHFIGHGRLTNGKGEIILVREASGLADPVDGPSFAELFNRARESVAVAVLQACDGAARSSTAGIGSVASLVAEQNVPVVVAMQYEIANLTARQFVLEMYRRVAQMEPVDQAVQEARRTLANKQSYEQRAFATPVLYMRTEDGNLFRRRSTDVPRVTPITQQLTALGAVLQSIAWAPSDVRAAYQAVAPPGPWIAPPAESTDPAETVRRMLDRLATAPADDSGLAPVLELVQRLAGMSVAKSSRPTLEQWVTQTATDLGAKQTTLAAMRERVQASGDASASQMLYLLIKLQPLSDAFAELHTRYQVDAWVLREGYDQPRPLRPEPRTVTPDQLEEIVNWLRAKINDDLNAASNNLTIEFLLPNELLGWRVEALRVKIGKLTRQLAAKYDVLVRSYDRLYDAEMRTSIPEWQTKWRRYQELVRSGEDGQVVWATNAAECDSDRFVAQLDPADRVCLALTFAPPVDPATGQSDVLWTMLSTGIPIAVWPRTEAGPQLTDELHAVLDQTVLRDLPRAIARKRREALLAEPGAARLGQQLTLLWDDPDHLPPDLKPFQAPPRIRRKA